MRGGRSLAAAGSVQRPNEYYFGATGGGLWKTADSGVTWAPVTDGQIRSSSVGAVAVSESNPDVVYIGMGESQLRGSIIQGDGVYRSADAGKTWIHAGLADSQTVARVRVHPANPDLVYAAVLGHPYGPNEQRGVFRSVNGGKSWTRVLYRSDHAGATDLCLDPHNPRVLYASLWDVYRSPWTLSSGGPGSGVFKSSDGGDTWTEITRNPGMPAGILGKIGVTVSGADGGRLYAIIEADQGGVFRSDDAGATWARVSEDRNLRQRAFYYTRIYADPKVRDTVYVLNVGLFKSVDGGTTYRQLRPRHSDNHDLWIAPDNSQRMIGSNDGGASVSVNGGQTWTGQNYPTAQLYHVTTTQDVPYHVCGAQQDNSTLCVPSRTAPALENPLTGAADRSYTIANAESGYVAANPADPDIFFAGSQAGEITRFDRRSGNLRDVQVDPLFFSGMPASALRERWQWTFPIVYSPRDPHMLFTCSQHVFRTTNEGQTWERISPDLTRGDPKTLGDSGGPITKDQNGPEIYGTVFTLAPSRQDANTIWAGSDDGVASITRDGGKTWQKITPAGLPEFSRISLIEASPHDPRSAYLAAKRYQLDDRRPYVYKTSDYGTTWAKIVDGIPANDFVHAVREDPVRKGLLYAGTEHGVYVSFDAGAHWQSLSLNLPDTQVPDLVVHGNDLVIATHGRSFYILDDLASLRQLTPEAAAERVYLFAPPETRRSLDDVVIDYYLAKPESNVIIEIIDGDGTVAKSFVVGEQQRKAGVNRVRWDLRYPGSTVFPGLVLRGAQAEVGPTAPPGEYRVQIKTDEVLEEQDLVIRRSPLLKDVTDSDLEAQFKFAIQVRDKTSEANGAVAAIRAIKKALSESAAKGRDAGLSDATATLAGKLSLVEEQLYQVKNQSPRDTLNYPIKLNNQLAALSRIVETGDERPTDSSYRVFRELSGTLDRLVTQMKAALRTDVPRINELLKARGLDPIQPPR